MSPKKPIHRLFCWIVAAMLLIVAGGRSFPGGQPGAEFKQTASIQAPDAEKSTDGSAADGRAMVTELCLNAVVITSFVYAFAHDCLAAPVPLLLIERIQQVIPRHFTLPDFFFTFFYRVFGNQIVANAP